MRSAFARYGDLARLSNGRHALETIRDELGDPTSDRVLEMLIVAHDCGQSVAMGILRGQANEISLDSKAAAEARTARLEPVLTARIAFVIPFLTLLMMCWQVPEFARFYRGAGGFIVVTVGGALSSLGLVVARRLARDIPEPRVLV